MMAWFKNAKILEFGVSSGITYRRALSVSVGVAHTPLVTPLLPASPPPCGKLGYLKRSLGNVSMWSFTSSRRMCCSVHCIVKELLVVLGQNFGAVPDAET